MYTKNSLIQDNLHKWAEEVWSFKLIIYNVFGAERRVDILVYNIYICLIYNFKTIASVTNKKIKIP